MSTGSGLPATLVAWLLAGGIVVASPLGALGQETAEDIRDVKDLVEIPEPAPYGLWIALALGAVFLGLLIWKLLTRQRKAPSVPAAETAMSELEAARALIPDASPEPLANAATAAVRRYIEARFGIAAPRQTTEEFLHSLNARRHPEISPFGEDLSRFLRLCDAVKFGQGEIEVERRKNLVESAKRFVESSRRSSAASPTAAVNPKTLPPELPNA
ncbi:MAG: hypothetical protein WD342_02825 [Verrucomicrobiales bacterium]